MAAEYKLVVRRAGAKIAEWTDFSRLTYAKQVGRPGLIRFGLHQAHAGISLLATDDLIEVWRKDRAQELDWYIDHRGLYRSAEIKGREVRPFLGQAPGILSYLDRRVVAWYTNTANRSSFAGVSAERMSKLLVQYNTTADATTANSRLYDGTTSGYTITLEADADQGTALDLDCSFDNLLDLLYKISKIGGGDYDLINTSGTTWEFRWYLGQRGTDRTGSVVFATNYGNMVEPSYQDDRLDERTVAIVGGAGQASSRLIRTRTGPDYAAANKLELFVDKKSDLTTASLDDSGDKALDKWKRRQRYGFRIQQTQSTAYGKHYCIGGVMGDLVTAVVDGISSTQKIDRVSLDYQPNGREQIDVELADV